MALIQREHNVVVTGPGLRRGPAGSLTPRYSGGLAWHSHLTSCRVSLNMYLGQESDCPRVATTLSDIIGFRADVP